MRLRSERIVTPSGVAAGEVAVSDGRIVSVDLPAGGDVLDLGDRWLVPGFIDTHVHGGGGAQCNTSDPDEVAAVARFHASHGTTGMLATTIAAPIEGLEAFLRAVARCGGSVLGAHLEGPFLSPERPGAMDPSVFMAPERTAVERLLSAGRGTVRMMTLAPELPDALRLISSLVAADVIPSLGHSNATYEEASTAVRAGARSATHLFNGMREFHHRDPGLLGAALDLPEVSCELICDGVHVDPVAVRLVMRAKGAARVRLVTDAIEAAGMSDGQYRLGAAAVEVRSGVVTLAGGGGSIAGSTLTMDVAVRNAVRFLGISVPQGVALASTNPARLLGLGVRKGAIAPGMDADIAVLDDDLMCRGTMVGGGWVA